MQDNRLTRPAGADRLEQRLAITRPSEKPDAVAEKEGEHEKEDLVNQLGFKTLLGHVRTENKEVLSFAAPNAVATASVI